MEVTLTGTFHLSLYHQAALGALCAFLFCENLSAEIKILDVVKTHTHKNVVLIMTGICLLSLLALSYFLTRVDRNRKKGKIFRLHVTDE